MEGVLAEIDTDCDNVRIGHGLRSCCCPGGSTLPLSLAVTSTPQLKTVSNVVLPGWACLRTGEVQPKGGMAGMEEWPVPVFDTRLKLIEPCLSNSISRAGRLTQL